MSQQVGKSVTGSRRVVTDAGAALVPAEIRELLGPPPLTSSENVTAYERMFSRVALAIGPGDFIEWTWVRELVDLGWEIARVRRAKAVRLAMARKAAIRKLLDADRDAGTFDLSIWRDEIQEDVDAVYAGDVERIAAFQQALARLGLSDDALEDAAYLAALEDLQTLQDLADRASLRRDGVLREIERRRGAVAERARRAATALEAEFE